MMKSIMLWGLAVKSSYHIFLQRAHDINFLSTFFLEAISTGNSVLIIRQIINTFVNEDLYNAIQIHQSIEREKPLRN